MENKIAVLEEMIFEIRDLDENAVEIIEEKVINVIDYTATNFLNSKEDIITSFKYLDCFLKLNTHNVKNTVLRNPSWVKWAEKAHSLFLEDKMVFENIREEIKILQEKLGIKYNLPYRNSR